MEYNIKNNYYKQYRVSNKNKYLKRNKRIVLVLILLVLSVMFLKKVYANNSKEINTSFDTNSENKDKSSLIEKNDILNENEETIIIDNTENEKEEQQQELIVENDKKEEIVSNDIAEEKNVGIEYFKDAVFIGDSRTEGFILNNGLASRTTSYTSKGLQVNTVFTDKVLNMNGKKVTIIDALRNTSFSKVYIMLGINETGWVYNDLFIKKYGEIINEIRNVNPNCIIYVQSILPVTYTVSEEHKYIKNSKINEYNSLIEQMANEKNVVYLNVRECIVNQEEVLPEDAATDGIHLNKKYCEKWLEYLINHTI